MSLALPKFTFQNLFFCLCGLVYDNLKFITQYIHIYIYHVINLPGRGNEEALYAEEEKHHWDGRYDKEWH